MFRNLFLALGAVIFVISNASAQGRQCGSMEVLARQLMENPELQQRMMDIERHTEEFMHDQVHERAVITIPVVFNIVWNTTAENVSDAQIATQLQVLNDDFRRLNADATNTPAVWQSIAADCEINFCMAQQDPNGNATTGIRRQNTTVTSFSANDAMKFTSQGGLDIWDRDKYLNIWVCDLGSGLLGYAQFPGGGASTDGVVIDYQAFGTIGSALAPFNKGRTATHEVGHWLNLYHIWGDDGTSCTGTDQCADTPNQADENYSCPAFPQVSCSNGPNGDMFMNYMDYTDDACMNLFTAGQKTRMQAVLGTGGSRQSLASSPGCNPPSGCSAPSGLNATGITNTSATLNWGAVSGATSYNLQWKISTGSTWTTVSGLTTTSYNLTGLTAGTTYNYQVQTDCGGTLSGYSTAASFTTTGGSGCADQYEPNESRNTAKVIPVNTTFTAQIRTSTDKDYYKFSNTTATPKIKVDLTTLPADYDLKLYRGSTLLGTSQNGGTTSEQLIYNTTTISSNYVAYVYGYNGAFSSTQCYTFRVSLSASNWREDGSTDGQVEELEVPVVFENAGFGLFPNPASSEVTVEVPVTAESDVQVSVIDPSGKIVVSQNRVLAKGDNRIQLDVSRLGTGMYFVQVRNGEETHTRKLVINN